MRINFVDKKFSERKTKFDFNSLSHAFSLRQIMKLKSPYTTAIVVGYIFILIGFIAYKKSKHAGLFGSVKYDRNCSDPCINFCKSSSENYSDDKLKDGYKNISNYNSKYFEYTSSYSRKVSVNRFELVCANLQRKVIVDDLKGIDVYSVS